MDVSAESDDPLTRGLARRLGRFRGLAGALGLGTAASLAGCSSRPDAGPGTTAAPDTTPRASGPTASEPAATDPGQTTPAMTLSTGECRDRAAELGADLEAVRAELERLDAELPTLRRRRDNLEQIATLFEPPPADVVSAAEAVGTAAREAVVFLELGGGSATGWYVDEHHVVTNAHNVFDHHSGSTNDATVWTLGGDHSEATTVDFVPSLAPDVAVLRTDDPAPATLPPGSNPDRDSTEPLVQVGHPGGIGNWMVTLGALRGYVEYQTADGSSVSELQSSVPGRQGVSGSPVLNLEGEVVGLTYAGSPIQDKQPGEPPIVAEPVVYDRPIASLSWGNHVPIDTVMTYYEEWT